MYCYWLWIKYLKNYAYNFYKNILGNVKKKKYGHNMT